MPNPTTSSSTGPDWSKTGQLWIPDADNLDERFGPAIDAAFTNLRQTYVLIRWQDNQSDIGLIERWWGRQRRLIKAVAIARADNQALAATLGHDTEIDDEGRAWKVRTITVRRTRPSVVREAS